MQAQLPGGDRVLSFDLSLPQLHTLHMQEAAALARLHKLAGPPEPLKLPSAMITKILCAGPIIFQQTHSFTEPQHEKTCPCNV